MPIDARITALTNARNDLRGLAINLLAVVLDPLTPQTDIDALDSEIGSFIGAANGLRDLMLIRNDAMSLRDRQRRVRGEVAAATSTETLTIRGLRS